MHSRLPKIKSASGVDLGELSDECREVEPERGGVDGTIKPMNEVTDYGVAPIPEGGFAAIPDAVAANGIIVSAQIPLRADGTMEDGDTAAQTAAVLACLQTTLATLGLGLDRVMHATVYLTNMEEWSQMNAVWQSVFPDRSPSRAAIGTTALARPGMRVEMVVLIAQK